MTKPTEVGENPNDKMPPGKPLERDRAVSDDDASSAAIEREVAEELRDHEAIKHAETAENDLVNVGKFRDPAAKKAEGDDEGDASGTISPVR